MEVHDKIRVMREINQWSQEEMAEKLEMSANGYAKIERGQSSINLDKLKQIAEIFNIDIIDLLTKHDRPFFFLLATIQIVIILIIQISFSYYLKPKMNY